MNKLPEELERRMEKDAEKCGDDTTNTCAEGDEQAFYKDGVEFGFKRGAEAMYSLLQKEPELNPLWACVEALRKIRGMAGNLDTGAGREFVFNDVFELIMKVGLDDC